MGVFGGHNTCGLSCHLKHLHKPRWEWYLSYAVCVPCAGLAGFTTGVCQICRRDKETMAHKQPRVAGWSSRKGEILLLDGIESR